MKNKAVYILILAVFLGAAAYCHASGAASLSPVPQHQSLVDGDSLWKTLGDRAANSPVNFYATIIFACAVMHTFSYRSFLELSKTLRSNKIFRDYDGNTEILPRFLHLMGEVELIFAFWLIPLFWLFTYYYGWSGFASYLDDLAYNRNKYAEPVFVVLIMCIAATPPIIQLASDFINLFARMGGGSVKAWWSSVIFVGSLLGSFITEPAAMTICATLLLTHFFAMKPSRSLKYATIGLLFVSISIGGTLTTFSSPPVLMVAKTWDWNILFMMANFGWKVAIAIALSVALYIFIFRKEFAELEKRRAKVDAADAREMRIPKWIVAAHVLYLAAMVITMHYVMLMFFTFLAFLAFVSITKIYQKEIKFRNPVLVGIFLASLVTHGSLQGWWIEPLLMNLDDATLFVGSIALSAFNDNAAITYLASLVEGFTPTMKYLVVAAAVSGGGLTVIANAPNLAGLAVLRDAFPRGVSPRNLFLAAALPTLIASLIFFFAR